MRQAPGASIAQAYTAVGTFQVRGSAGECLYGAVEYVPSGSRFHVVYRINPADGGHTRLFSFGSGYGRVGRLGVGCDGDLEVIWCGRKGWAANPAISDTVVYKYSPQTGGLLATFTIDSHPRSGILVGCGGNSENLYTLWQTWIDDPIPSSSTWSQYLQKRSPSTGAVVSELFLGNYTSRQWHYPLTGTIWSGVGGDSEILWTSRIEADSGERFIEKRSASGLGVIASFEETASVHGGGAAASLGLGISVRSPVDGTLMETITTGLSLLWVGGKYPAQ